MCTKISISTWGEIFLKNLKIRVPDTHVLVIWIEDSFSRIRYYVCLYYTSIYVYNTILWTNEDTYNEYNVKNEENIKKGLIYI